MTMLGIDIGGSGIKGAPVNLETGQLEAKRLRLSTPRPATPKAIAEVLATLVDHFAWEGPLGIAFPARVKNGRVRTAVNIDRTWVGIDARQLFERKTGCPVVILNDADAAGLAEMAFGAGQGRKDLVAMFTFGTGIGSSLFLDGTLIPNIELGQLELRGKNVEAYATDRIRKEKELSWKAWAQRVQHFLDYIERLFGPDLIILGGGISRPLKREAYFHLLRTHADLVTAQLENEAGLIGAAYAASLT